MLMAAILLLGPISYELLPVAALPNIDSPTILVTNGFARRRCADRRQHRHDAARTEFRRDTRADANDLEQRHRIFRDYTAIRSQPHRRFGGARRPGGDQCDVRLSAAEAAKSVSL
jgi:hypothetical protein